MSIIIRRATSDDIAGIQHVAQTVLHAQYPPERAERFLQRVYAAESIERTLASDGMTMLVAVDVAADERTVGLCSFGSPLLDDCEDRKEIHRLFVHPDYERETIAELFLQAIEADLRGDVDVQRVSIYINPDDDAAFTFYSEQGYHHELVEDKEGEWYMEKTL